MDCWYSQWDGWMDWWNDGCKDATTRIDRWINATDPGVDEYHYSPMDVFMDGLVQLTHGWMDGGHHSPIHQMDIWIIIIIMVRTIFLKKMKIK